MDTEKTYDMAARLVARGIPQAAAMTAARNLLAAPRDPLRRLGRRRGLTGAATWVSDEERGRWCVGGRSPLEVARVLVAGLDPFSTGPWARS